MTRALITYRNAATADGSEERTELLKQLWADGRTCSQIVATMGGGLTRSAVAGKVRRLKLSSRKSPIKTGPRRPRVPRAAQGTAIKLGRARHAGFRSLEDALPKPVKQNISGPAWDALPDTTPIPLLTASDATCRWPIGDPLQPGFGFCGCPVDDGSVYCPTHRARGTTVFRATAEDKRKLDRMDRSRRVFA